MCICLPCAYHTTTRRIFWYRFWFYRTLKDGVFRRPDVEDSQRRRYGRRGAGRAGGGRRLTLGNNRSYPFRASPLGKAPSNGWCQGWTECGKDATIKKAIPLAWLKTYTKEYRRASKKTLYGTVSGSWLGSSTRKGWVGRLKVQTLRDIWYITFCPIFAVCIYCTLALEPT